MNANEIHGREPGRFYPEVLHQDRLWFDRYGRAHPLAEMSPAYLRAVIRYLERDARRLAGLGLESQIEQLDAEQDRMLVLELDMIVNSFEWLRRTRLVWALYAELARRGEPLEAVEAARADRFTLGTGEAVRIHPREECTGPCVYHAPSGHPLHRAPVALGPSGFPLRVCQHGIGHPDVDAVAQVARTYGEEYAALERVHECDGCCGQSYTTNKEGAR
jgi:hypothetical protein